MQRQQEHRAGARASYEEGLWVVAHGVAWIAGHRREVVGLGVERPAVHHLVAVDDHDVDDSAPDAVVGVIGDRHHLGLAVPIEVDAAHGEVGRVLRRERRHVPTKGQGWIAAVDDDVDGIRRIVVHLQRGGARGHLHAGGFVAARREHAQPPVGRVRAAWLAGRCPGSPALAQRERGVR